ncbi:MAG: hypothetical protein ACRCSQ_02240 [Bacteroidales bacterium]
MKQLFFLFFVFLFFSCQDQEVEYPGKDQFGVKFNYEASSSGDILTNVNALLYQEESLQHKETALTPVEGVYSIGTGGKFFDKIMFIAGNHGLDFTSLNPGLSDCKGMTTGPVDFETTFPAIHYTAEKEAGSLDNNLMNIELIRSVARLDVVKETTLDVVIESCEISNLIDRSYVFPGNTSPLTGGELKTQTLGADAFAKLNDGIQGFAYIYENAASASEILFYVRINGVKNKLKATLPKVIERNKKYEIKIKSNGAVIYTSLSILEWGDGGSVDTQPGGFIPKIDLSTSQLPEGVVASKTLDTLFIAPDYSGVFILGLDAPVETEAKVESSQIGVATVPDSRNSYIGNQFALTVESSRINQVKTIIPMMIKSVAESQYYNKQIVLVKQGYRTWFKNLNAVLNSESASWDDYRDGYIAEVEAWNGYQASDIEKIETRSGDAQFDWLRVVSEDGVNTVDGAFKVNDTEATGQEQRSIMTVTYKDGVEEVFSFKRKRYSLPVITQGGKYWSKYNMRGNSKSYADQIGFDRDIARDTFQEYLKTCSDEDFVYYAGATYKGKSTNGLYLKSTVRDGETTPVLLYDGYADIPDGQVSNGPADAHCPAGFQMPGRDEWNYIWYTGGQLTLPGSGSTNPYNASAGNNRYMIHRFTRNDLIVDGVTIPQVSFLWIEDIRNHQGEKMVFTGLGNQSANITATLGQIIFPVVTTGPTHFVMDFNTNRTSYGNLSGPGVHTRTIRCVKSPVNYIIN